ncbi:glycosyltransferase family 4 protein [bacterium]|jgi:glycosyltransferase involved in cell wall biosynthesis|nr:glycosyltransferase family 4 protein [bacterium]MBT4251651.1 glycosyltransferase family 4 protein [bacterium]MBT4597700.1 glycosyltransferase family 4 protein [bacterium]MBT6753713.1 glycosyltransferase family 4 protein [bacterium]MBT7037850.1 glycosyltransferase family 4 protein [bacterium]
MKIGIDASRALIKQRTGIEEYAYQTIKNLREPLGGHEVFLYIKEKDQKNLDFKLPVNWTLKVVPFNYFWTQLGLSWEMLMRPTDILFIPAHTVPFVYPRKTVVTVHGLEYEHCPEGYSLYSRWFHHFFITRSCRWAKKIIAVSQNTKKDLKKIYKIPKEKISVVYNGFELSGGSNEMVTEKEEVNYILYIGRIEERKNIKNIVKAFEILKKKYGYKGELLLAGKSGYGHEKIKETIKKSEFKKDIKCLGFISDKEKQELLTDADLFLFPSLCEGFGIPILEAQSVGTPVVTSNFGPMDEVAGNNEILAIPTHPKHIADVAQRIISDEKKCKEVVKKGFENTKRFSWKKCGEGVAKVLLN